VFVAGQKATTPAEIFVTPAGNRCSGAFIAQFPFRGLLWGSGAFARGSLGRKALRAAQPQYIALT